jgi:hypothetical protein
MLNDNARRGSCCVARVWCACWLNEQNVDFTSRNGSMLYSFWHDEDITRVERYSSISQLNVQYAPEHQEKIIRVIMLVPVERAVQFSNHDVVIVVSRHSTRGEFICKRRKLFGKVGWRFHLYHQKVRETDYRDRWPRPISTSPATTKRIATAWYQCSRSPIKAMASTAAKAGVRVSDAAVSTGPLRVSETL